jgi:hypothetical protein
MRAERREDVPAVRADGQFVWIVQVQGISARQLNRGERRVRQAWRFCLLNLRR